MLCRGERSSSPLSSPCNVNERRGGERCGYGPRPRRERATRCQVGGTIPARARAERGPWEAGGRGGREVGLNRPARARRSRGHDLRSSSCPVRSSTPREARCYAVAACWGGEARGWAAAAGARGYEYVHTAGGRAGGGPQRGARTHPAARGAGGTRGGRDWATHFVNGRSACVPSSPAPCAPWFLRSKGRGTKISIRVTCGWQSTFRFRRRTRGELREARRPRRIGRFGPQKAPAAPPLTSL